MDLTRLSDQQILDRLQELVSTERENTAEIVAHLAEVDRRDLLLERGYHSLFAYCTSALGYSPPSAYHRIRAARAARRHPRILDMLRSGEMHLEDIVTLHPHLENGAGDALLDKAKGKSHRDIEKLAASLSPRPLPRETIRFISVSPAPPPAAPADMPLFSAHQAPQEAAPSEPVATRVHVSFAADPSFMDLVQRAREIMRHKYPDGRLDAILREALMTLLDKRDPDRRLIAALPRASSGLGRAIPQWIKDRAWKRAGGRCAFRAPDGKLCGSRDGLEYDHIKPWALGGASNDPDNVRILCRAHNQHLARRLFGKKTTPPGGLPLSQA